MHVIFRTFVFVYGAKQRVEPLDSVRHWAGNLVGKVN